MYSDHVSTANLDSTMAVALFAPRLTTRPGGQYERGQGAQQFDPNLPPMPSGQQYGGGGYDDGGYGRGGDGGGYDRDRY